MAKGRKKVEKIETNNAELDEIKSESIIVTEENNIIIDELNDTVDYIEHNTQTNNSELFAINMSEYGIKTDEAEKFVNTAIKFYFDNRDKVFVENNTVTESETEDNKEVLNFINDFEKSLKLFNYVPKNKVITFLKKLKEIS
jgi:hypothetical protein